MTTRVPPTRVDHEEERILDLLTEKLERPLTTNERAELERLLVAHPDWRRHDLAYAAAAIHEAMEPPFEDMPDDVKARLIGRVVGEATRSGDPDSTRPLSGPQAPAQKPALRLEQGGGNRASGKASARAFVPWMAAAAAIALAVVGWWPREGDGTVATREAIAEESGAVVVAWAQTADPLGRAVAGDVVWSASRQAGFMRFTGLPANDPTKEQYQLWIFDAERDERYPVDGGVFDIAPSSSNGGESVVAIRARVPVGKVTLFAVTLERPGGVVVSTRERLVALGKVG